MTQIARIQDDVNSQSSYCYLTSLATDDIQSDVNVKFKSKDLEFDVQKNEHIELVAAATAEKADTEPVLIIMIDQYGIAHAPFAQARALLSEHGYGEVKVIVHNAVSRMPEVTTITALTPQPVGGKLLCPQDLTAL